MTHLRQIMLEELKRPNYARFHHPDLHLHGRAFQSALPSFMRIRNFGFLANRRRAELLPLCSRLLQPSDQPAAGTTLPALPIHPLWQCPLCGGTMQIVERLSAAQLLLRSPPHLSRCAS